MYNRTLITFKTVFAGLEKIDFSTFSA